MEERKDTKFDPNNMTDETGDDHNDQFCEAAKDNFMSFMEVVWPTVANYYFQVEREISDTIQKATSVKGIGVQFSTSDHHNDDLNDKSKLSPGPQGDKELEEDRKNKCCEINDNWDVTPSSGDSSSLSLYTYDCSAANKRRSEFSRIKSPGHDSETNNTHKKIVKIQDTNGSVTWDVVETKSSSSSQGKHNNVQIKNSTPILVHDSPASMFYTTTGSGIDSVSPDIREALFSADTAIREALSTCFGKISKSFTSSYPRIRFVLNKSYHQIRHTVSCSYPNVQYTINNSYDKVQGAVKSSYPKIRKTVNSAYPKNRIITACYRKFRQLYSSKYPTFSQTVSTANRLENSQLAKALVDANFDICTRLGGANAEISQALHNSSKKVSISLATANLEILQSLKNASSRVSKSLVKANSEVLESLAMANDDLQKSLKIAQNEALRSVDTIKKELSKKLFDLHPKVLRKILFGFDDLVRELNNANLELLETLAKASTEVCNQISLAHAKYSEAKVNSNYQLSLNLAKANSQVLQVLIQANSKVSDVLEKNSEKVQQVTSNFKSGQRPDGLEQKIWKIIEKGETEIWKVAENASFTIESAVENTEGKLWKIADCEFHSLRKSVETIEHKLSSTIASAEWKLKRCAEKLENQVITDTVGHFIQIAWSAVTSYVNENLGRKIFQKFYTQQQQQKNNNQQRGDSSRPDFEMRIPEIENGRGSVQVLVCYNNEYYVGFPDDDDDGGGSGGGGENDNYAKKEETNINVDRIGPSLEHSHDDDELLKIKENNALCLMEKDENKDIDKTVKIVDDEKEQKLFLTACSGSLNLISDQLNQQQQQYQRDSDYLKEFKEIEQDHKKQQKSQQSTTIMKTILEEACEILNNNIIIVEQDKILDELLVKKLEKYKTATVKLILKSNNHNNFVDDDEKQGQIVQEQEEDEAKNQILSTKLANNEETLLLPSCRKSMDDTNLIVTSSVKNLQQPPIEIKSTKIKDENCNVHGDDHHQHLQEEVSMKRPTTTTISFHEPFEMCTEYFSMNTQEASSDILGPSIQELSACFRTNLQKIQDTLVSSRQASSSPLNAVPMASSSSFSLNPVDSFTILETRQLIEECHKAWNIITSLYNTSNEQKQLVFDLKNESFEASTMTNGINYDFIASNPCDKEVEEQIKSIQPDCDKKLSKSDSIFSYIKWESVSSTSQLGNQIIMTQGHDNDNKTVLESCDMDLIMKETQCQDEVENVDFSLSSSSPLPMPPQTERPSPCDHPVPIKDRPGTRAMDTFEVDFTENEGYDDFIISELPIMASPSHSNKSVNINNNDTASNFVEEDQGQIIMSDQRNFDIEIPAEDDNCIDYVPQISHFNDKKVDDSAVLLLLIDSDGDSSQICHQQQRSSTSSSPKTTIREKGKKKLKSISKNLRQLLAKTRKASTALGSAIRKKARIKGWKYKKYCPNIPISSLRLCWRGRPHEPLSSLTKNKINFVNRIRQPHSKNTQQSIRIIDNNL